MHIIVYILYIYYIHDDRDIIFEEVYLRKSTYVIKGSKQNADSFLAVFTTSLIV